MVHQEEHKNQKVAVSHVATQRHVTTAQKTSSGKAVAVKPEHAYVLNNQKMIITDVMSPSPNSLALVNGAQIKYFLEANNARNIETIDIRFQVTVANGPLKLPPVSKWFNRLEIYIRDSGKEVCRLYNDVLHVMLNIEDKDVIANYARTYNQSPVYDRNQEDNKVIQDGQQYFYLPLPRSFFHKMNLDLHTIKSDLEFRFHPDSSIMSQFSGDLVLDEIAAVIQENHPDELSAKSHIDFLNNHVVQHTYSDCQQYIDSAQTLNASTQYEFDLDQFDDDSSALLVCIRADSSNDFQCLDIGNGTFDLIGVSGESMYGGGRPIVYDFFNKHIVCNQLKNDFFDKTKFMLIPFGNLKDTFNGITSGLHHFNSTKQRLQITTPVAGTNAFYTAVLSATAATYNLRVKYQDSYVDVLGNATPAAMTLAVSNMLSSYGLKCVVEQAVGGTFTVSFEITSLAGQPVKLESNLEVYMSSNTGATTFNSFVETTAGVNGWVNGTYSVYIYSIYHRNIYQDGSKLMVVSM